MDIGKRIKEFRLKKGITVNKLANISGISQSYLRDIELGNKQPTVEYLSYICDGLGISMEYFFRDNKVDSQNAELSLLIGNMTDEQKKALVDFLKSFYCI